jgi:hypothetical protein
MITLIAVGGGAWLFGRVQQWSKDKDKRGL